jgi:predicted ATPase
MIESIEFTNFKALRKTTLPLSPFSLLLGPNGSGKTTVLQALQRVASLAAQPDDGVGNLPVQHGVAKSLLSITELDPNALVEVSLRLRFSDRPIIATFRWYLNGQVNRGFHYENGSSVPQTQVASALQWLAGMQVYALDHAAIMQPNAVSSLPLQYNGYGLAAALDDLKDNHPERWNTLLLEMQRWVPEYDFIQFEKPQQGQKAIKLRTKKGGYAIPAHELSQGTLLSLALLTVANTPSPPSLVALEEIDRGLHPRLLRHLQDALYRLSYPESCGETRPPIQVIATTHSPYLLDLYRDHPEEIVLAEKEGLEVKMTRLSDIDYFSEILGDSPLREVWYSGVLGGVAVKE